jgi:hypothetical protein
MYMRIALVFNERVLEGVLMLAMRARFALPVQVEAQVGT